MGLLDRVRGTAEVAPELDPEGGTSTVGAAGGGKAKAHVPHLDDEVADAAKVASLSLFTDREIKHLWKLFNQIDADGTGSISHDEMLQLPQLKYNPLGKRVIVATFPKEAKETLSFNDFVAVLSVFAPATSDDAKLRLAFRVFDFDDDKFLGRGDLEQLLQALLPVDTEEKLRTHILDEVLKEADQDQDEKLSYDEFLKAVAHSDIRSKLTIPF